MTTKATQRARLASHTPGRLRIKLAHRDPDTLGRLKRDLEAREGVQGVRVNPANGSLTLHYDWKRHSTAGILGLLEDLDVVIEGLTHAPSAFEEGGDAGAALTVGEAIDDLNVRLRRWTRLPVELRTVLPLAFVGAGLWSMVRNGLMLDSMPGWLLLWLGFDLFVKTRPHEVVRHASRRKIAEQPRVEGPNPKR